MSAVASTIPVRERASARLSGWTVLVIDGLRLALPQRDVRLIELVANLRPAPDTDRGAEAREIGRLARDDNAAWPVYCLDSELRLQWPAPDARRLCVFIAMADNPIGIACDRIDLLATDAELTVGPVPGCMTGMPSPIIGFARYQASVVAVLDVVAVTDYLDYLRGLCHGADE